MSQQITVANAQMYGTNVQHLLQQRGSRTGMCVTRSTAFGKAAKAVEQIGSVAPRRRTVRHGDTPQMDTPHGARWAHPHDYDWSDWIDSEDRLRLIIDPQSQYAEAAAFAMGRAEDEEVFAALLGTAQTGEDGNVGVPLPSGQVILDATFGLTYAKFREAKKMLMASNVDLDHDEIYCAVSADQHDDLYDFTGNVVVSSDYNPAQPLVKGKVNNFMGVNFIHSELVPQGGVAGARQVIMWAKSGLQLCTWNSLTTRVSERADKNYLTQVFASQTLGAVRVEEEKVVVIECV